MTRNFLDDEARARGLTRKGRDLVLAPYPPVRYNPDSFPLAPTAGLLADADAVGLTFWGEAPGTGFRWATDDRQRFHAVHSGTRKGQRQSQHACLRMRQALSAETVRLTSTAYWALSGFERDDAWRQREILRLQLALANSLWACETDGPIVEHAADATAAVAALFSTAAVLP